MDRPTSAARRWTGDGVGSASAICGSTLIGVTNPLVASWVVPGSGVPRGHFGLSVGVQADSKRVVIRGEEEVRPRFFDRDNSVDHAVGVGAANRDHKQYRHQSAANGPYVFWNDVSGSVSEQPCSPAEMDQGATDPGVGTKMWVHRYRQSLLC